MIPCSRIGVITDICRCGKRIYTSTGEAFEAIINFKDDGRGKPVRYYQCILVTNRLIYHITRKPRGYNRKNFDPQRILLELRQESVPESYKIQFIKNYLANQPGRRATARQVMDAFADANPDISPTSIQSDLSKLVRTAVLTKYKSSEKNALTEYILPSPVTVRLPAQKEIPVTVEIPKPSALVSTPALTSISNEISDALEYVTVEINGIKNALDPSNVRGKDIWKEGYSEGFREGIKFGMELSKEGI